MPIYKCELCDFECTKLSNFNIHNNTRKHINAAASKQMETNGNIMEIQFNAASDMSRQISLKCQSCSKEYKTRCGLWKHSKTCLVKTPDASSKDILESIKKNPDTAEILLAVLKDNTELRTLMVEQNNKIINLMAAQPAPVTNITNNTNTINNQFNLNVFLNETCRDAMNINEFIENIEIQMKELEFVANNGYVAGITDIILTRLKQLDVSKRPVHCTDLKRETLYVKDSNEWNKDTTDNSKIKNMITKVAKKNYRQIPKWREQNPECQNPENEKYDFCINMMRNSLGELGDEQIKLDDKIMKNIAKVVVVDKSL
jgi:hypothetical protein